MSSIYFSFVVDFFFYIGTVLYITFMILRRNLHCSISKPADCVQTDSDTLAVSRWRGRDITTDEFQTGLNQATAGLVRTGLF